MNIFLAGATGAIGRPSVRILAARGHRVFGMTRKESRSSGLWDLGAVPVVVDAFDAVQLERAMKAIRPDAVIHQLTDLATMRDPGQMTEAFRLNAHLRIVGTDNLVKAAVAAGAGQMVAQSIALFYQPGHEPSTEDTALQTDVSGTTAVSLAGVNALELAVLGTTGLRGCVLRYGLLYGPGTGNDGTEGLDMPVHVEAAAWAAVLAVEQKAAGVYNVTEANPRVQTEKIRRDLHWDDSLRASSQRPENQS